jgi:aspartate aminotransferase-like enzyme
MGLELYLNSGMSNTVTVIKVPENKSADDIIRKLRQKYGIQIAGGFDYLKGKVLRIGHMGENCRMEDVNETLEALKEVIDGA